MRYNKKEPFNYNGRLIYTSDCKLGYPRYYSKSIGGVWIKILHICNDVVTQKTNIVYQNIKDGDIYTLPIDIFMCTDDKGYLFTSWLELVEIYGEDKARMMLNNDIIYNNL